MVLSELLIEDNGSQNVIIFEDESNFKNSKIIINGNNNNIKLGCAASYKNLIINIEGNNKYIEILPSIYCIDGLNVESIAGNNQKLYIKDDLTCKDLNIVMNASDDECYIGSGSVFSTRINIKTSEEYSLVDITTKETILLEKSINIGDKVYVSENVNFLSGATVADNCLVKMNSVVRSKFETPNCMIEGVPAEVIKENIQWKKVKPPELYIEKDSKPISLVTIVCNHDYHFLEAQINSIERYAKNINFIEHLIICNDDDLVDKVNDLVAKLNYTTPVVIKARDGMLKPENKILRGWYTQQVLKLFAHKYVKSEYYLVLDSKNFLINTTQESDFFVNGKPILYTMKERRVWGDIIIATSKKLNIDPDSITWFSSPSTPFMMITEHVKAMYDCFDDVRVEDLICDRQSITEFILYYLFCMKNELTKDYELKDIKQSENCTLFKSAKISENFIDELREKELSMKWFGVHAMHFKTKNNVLLSYLEKLLLEKDIFISSEDVQNYFKRLS